MSSEQTSYVGKFAKRRFADKFLLLEALILIVVIRIGLSIRGYAAIARFVDRFDRGDSTSSNSADSFSYRAAWAVSKASRIIKNDKPCLAQSLALRLLLNRKGLGSKIVIGVKKSDDFSIQAHAWVEKEGEVLIGGASSPFRYAIMSAQDEEQL